jgi:hypothetical protein
MAGRVAPTRLYRLLDQVELQGLTDYASLDALARAHSGHKGAGELLGALRAHHAGTDTTKSDLEALFLGLCHEHGLPTPRVNHTVAAKEVDFLFPDDRLVVETDSWRFHKTRQAFGTTAPVTPASRAPATAPSGSLTVSSSASREWSRRPSARTSPVREP